MPSKTLVIAEAGVNHNGSLDLALRMVDEAARVGADAIKFQTFKAESLVTKGAPKAEYQQKNAGADGDQFSMLKALELSQHAHEQVARRCIECGIEFMSTPFDAESADFLIGLGMRRLKIPSGELTNKPFLEYLASKKLPVILSTGMADLEEVTEAVGWIQASSVLAVRSRADFLTLLHCTSSYPAELEDANLRAIRTLAGHFNLPVGYSDHTQGILVASVAVGLGASVIEKHFTLDRNLPGPDHKASLEIDEFERMVIAIRSTEIALGDGIKRPRPVELSVRDLVRRSAATATALPKGHILKSQDLILLRPASGIAPKALGAAIGRTLKRSMEAHSTLRWEDLE